jgi:hypothetical protein
MNADYIFKAFMQYQDLSTSASGLRIGYHLCFTKATWHDTNNNKITNIPSYTPNGFYILLVIGGGTFIKN